MEHLIDRWNNTAYCITFVKLVQNPSFCVLFFGRGKQLKQLKVNDTIESFDYSDDDTESGAPSYFSAPQKKNNVILLTLN